MAKRVRRVLGNVRWAFRASTPEDRNLCKRCRIEGGPGCPKERDLQPRDQQTMIATRCVFFEE